MGLCVCEIIWCWWQISTWGDPNVSGLVLPSAQHLCLRQAPVDGRTTVISESACQVSRSWDDMNSFYTRLFGVVYVTLGDLHDGSEKGTTSVHQILCQSWEKCYGKPLNDSTSLRGPKFESYIGVSMACPVQDLSHIGWRRRTHRETHKLHNSWNCCTNSRAHPSGSTSDHSRHCW